MAVYIEDIIDIELESGTVHRTFMNKPISEGDYSGNRFGVRLLRNNAPEDLTGVSCVGYFIRADGVTLVISGAKENGVLYVELPAAAYAVEGQFTLAIKAGGTGFFETVRIVDGTVVMTTTATINDPSSAVPDLSDLEAIISDAEDAADAVGALHVTATQITGTRYQISVTIDEG